MPRYIYPPRPQSRILPDQLPDEERRGIWCWQYKYNGDRCIAIVEKSATGRKITFANRHGKFTPSTKLGTLRKELSSKNFVLPVGTHYLDGELISGDILILYDVLQLTQYLFGKTLEERYRLLSEVCGNPSEPCVDEFALKVTDHVWMAPMGDSDFVQNFNRYITHKLIEGLVLKRKGSILDNWGSTEYEIDWQLRCRKPSKNYTY